MSAIVYSPSRRGPLRWSGRPGADIFQFSDQGLQDRHEPIESTIAPRRQAKSSWIPVGKQEIFGLLHARLTQPGVAGIRGMATCSTGY
jgi:hypothetical protein